MFPQLLNAICGTMHRKSIKVFAKGSHVPVYENVSEADVMFTLG